MPNRPDPPNPLRLEGAPPWVSVSTEVCRGGRVLHTISNGHTRVALNASADDVEPDGSPSAVLRADLEAAGCFDLNPGPATHAGAEATVRSRLVRFVATLDLPIARADGTVRRLHRAGLHLAFRTRAVAAQIALAIAGLVALLIAWSRGPAIEMHVTAGRMPFVLAAGLVAVAVHEFAHALVIVHHGRRVDGFGFRLHLATPAFYVESVDALHLTRRQRIIQAAAGPWAEWLVTSCAAILLLAVPGGTTGSLLRRFALLNTFNVVSNLLPFVGLDGALILADAIGVPDLPHRARGSVGRVVGMLARRTRPDRGTWGLAAYALANALAATALLVLSGWMWVNLFGDSVRGLWARGPLGVAVVVISACVVTRPALLVIGPRVLESGATLHRLAHDRRFRRSVRWRIPATHALVGEVPALATLAPLDLGRLAGLLERRPAHRSPAPEGYTVRVRPSRGRRAVHATLTPQALERVLAAAPAASTRRLSPRAGPIP